MKRLSFILKFHKDSTHYVQVHLWPTRAIMRGILAKKGHDSSNTDAACWQPNRFQMDGLVAEVHYARDVLCLDTIAHEMCHAAYWRVVILGIPKADDRFQEWVATDTGVLTAACVAFLNSKGVKFTIFKKQ